jgi:putative protease
MTSATTPTTSAPELLAPAGDWHCAKAAVANGADAIYLGLDCGHNARTRAGSFPLDDLPRLYAFLHRNRVRGYLCLNTLAFSNELESLEKIIRRAAEAGVDGILVQDLGLVHLIRELVPQMPIHASTQMTLTSGECIAVVQQLGIDRIVLPRELSVREIARIRSQTSVTLETFVHGALCVAYSGQCLTSESLGGRSANRGHCAQACRLPYDVTCDGQNVDLADRKYLLSPQDLAAYALVPELIQAGVGALKIEGRLKSPEYVANITRHYRRAIDAAVAGSRVDFSERQIEEMELSFSRGFSVGWLHGCDHKSLVPATSSAKRGVLVGHVHRVRPGRVHVALQGRLKAGDGVAFQGDRAAGQGQGGRILAVYRKGRRLSSEVDNGVVELAFRRGTVDASQLWPGQQVWKTDDPALTRRLRKSFAGDIRDRELPLEIVAEAKVGSPLRLELHVDGLPRLTCASEERLAAATQHPLTHEVLKHQLGRLGGSGFTLARLAASIAGTPMVPFSVLGKLRHEMIAMLQAARQQAATTEWTATAEPVLRRLRGEIDRPEVQPFTPRLLVLCRSLHQLRVVLDHDVPAVYADFQDIRQYGQAVSLARAGQTAIFLATPRIQKPGEIGIFHALARHSADGVLVRNLAGLDFFRRRSVPCIADYTLNAANELTLAYLRRLGAVRVTTSYDLNRDQLLELVAHAPADSLEVVIHQHMPMFHMEHCVFCAVLSPGTNKTNCGRPCDRHQVELRDRVGAEHPLKADVGCRNTLFNAVPQSGAEVVQPLLQADVRHFRIELLNDDAPEQLGRTIRLYRDLLEGKAAGRDVWTALKAMNRVGVTRGTLEHGRDPLAIL